MKHLLVLLICATAQAADLDMFLIAGQSNAAGAGVAAQSPQVVITTPPYCMSYYNGAIVNGNDPVGAGTGSAWPSFMRVYQASTRRAVMVVPCAFGGTGQTVQTANYYGFGSNHWDVGGDRVPYALSVFTAAKNAASTAGWTPWVRGVLWCQGEQDARAMAAGAVTAAQYKAALSTMIDRFRTAFPNMCFYVFRSGRYGPANNSPAVEAGCQAIRDRQEQIAYSGRLRNVFMVFRGAKYFEQLGMLQADGAHYTQPGYNLMGREGALGVLTEGISSVAVTVDTTMGAYILPTP